MQLVLGQPEVARRAVETEAEPARTGTLVRTAMVAALAAEQAGPEQRQAVRQALLRLVALFLGELAGGDRRIDPRPAAPLIAVSS